MKNTILLIVLGSLLACKSEIKEQEIIDRAIAIHGGQLFETSSVKFDFRNKSYSMYYDAKGKVYTRTFMDDSLGQVNDTLINSTNMTKHINGKEVAVSAKRSKIDAEAINSVLYFFQLPYGLNDEAVKKEILPKNIVNGHMYHKIKVTFSEEGGGDDFDDTFVYWINEKTYTVDYLAYAYHTSAGGQRFREATNRRDINGLIVQDYINYKADNSTVSVHNLDTSFETGQLKQLSVIKNENIIIN